MREPVRDKGRLEHIMAAIDIVLSHTGKTQENAPLNPLEYYGVVKNIEIIGEATYKLSVPFKQQHPDVPWDVIVKMRHVPVHDYYHISEDDVWDVVQNDLPPLKAQVERLLAETDWDEWEKRKHL